MTARSNRCMRWLVVAGLFVGILSLAPSAQLQAAPFPPGWSTPYGQRGGSGLYDGDGNPADIRDAVVHDGDLWVTGLIAWADQQIARTLVRWDGKRWSVEDWMKTASVEFLHSDGERLYAFEREQFHILENGQWKSEPSFFSGVHSMTWHDGDLYCLAQVYDPGYQVQVFRRVADDWVKLPVELNRNDPSIPQPWHIASINGSLLLTGNFADVNGERAAGIAQLGPDDHWTPGPFATHGSDGSRTTAMGEPIPYEGGFVALCSMVPPGGSSRVPIIRWDGAQWQTLPPVRTVFVLGTGLNVVDGKIHVMGSYDVGSETIPALFVLEGDTWKVLGRPLGGCCRTWILDDTRGGLYVVGNDLAVLSTKARRVENGAAFGIRNGNAYPLTVRESFRVGLRPYAFPIESPLGVLMLNAVVENEYVRMARPRGRNLEAMPGIQRFQSGLGGFRTVTTMSGDLYLYGDFQASVDDRYYGVMRWDGDAWVPVSRFHNRGVAHATTWGARTVFFSGAEVHQLEADGTWTLHPFRHATPKTVEVGEKLLFVGSWVDESGTRHGEDGLFYSWDGESMGEEFHGLRMPSNYSTKVFLLDDGPAALDFGSTLILEGPNGPRAVAAAAFRNGKWEEVFLPQELRSHRPLLLGRRLGKMVIAVERPTDGTSGPSLETVTDLYYLERGGWHRFAEMQAPSDYARRSASDDRTLFIGSRSEHPNTFVWQIRAWTGSLGSASAPDLGPPRADSGDARSTQFLGRAASGTARPELSIRHRSNGTIAMAVAGASSTFDEPIKIYDSRGRLVVSLDPKQVEGSSLVWRAVDSGGRPVAPGVYFVRTRVGGHVLTGRTVLR